MRLHQRRNIPAWNFFYSLVRPCHRVQHNRAIAMGRYPVVREHGIRRPAIRNIGDNENLYTCLVEGGHHSIKFLRSLYRQLRSRMRRRTLELIRLRCLGIETKVARANHEQMPRRLALITQQVCGTHFRRLLRNLTASRTDTD